VSTAERASRHNPRSGRYGRALQAHVLEIRQYEHPGGLRDDDRIAERIGRNPAAEQKHDAVDGPDNIDRNDRPDGQARRRAGAPREATNPTKAANGSSTMPASLINSTGSCNRLANAPANAIIATPLTPLNTASTTSTRRRREEARIEVMARSSVWICGKRGHDASRAGGQSIT
jgi:hypothetical protein